MKKEKKLFFKFPRKKISKFKMTFLFSIISFVHLFLITFLILLLEYDTLVYKHINDLKCLNNYVLYSLLKCFLM